MSVKKKYTADDKTRTAIEALKSNITLNEISSKFQVHSTQINKWKTFVKSFLKSEHSKNIQVKKSYLKMTAKHIHFDQIFLLKMG